MLTSLKLLTTAGLGAGYLAILFLAGHPHVDSEYAAHYLHRTAECWVPRALRANERGETPPSVVEIGQLSQPESCRYLRRGWWGLKSWGAWAHGDRAILELPRKPGARAVELTIRSVPAPGPTIPVLLTLNGRTTEDDVVPGTTTTLTFPLPPAGQSYDPHLYLTFGRYAIIDDQEPGRPGVPDKEVKRHVSIGLVAIHYLPAQRGAKTQPDGQSL